MDKLVARFYAHFFEERNWDRYGPLGDPQMEKEICRLVTIQYYLYDNEVQILEPKVTNAGMPSGTFFRKNVMIKDDGTPLRLEELVVGGDIRMLGQEFFITDADEFTRQYFRDNLNTELLHPLPRPRPLRKDAGAQTATNLGSQLPKVKTHFGTRSTDFATTKEVLDKTSRFLKYEGRVLRFQCVEVKSKVPPYFPELQEKAADSGYYGLVASGDVKRFALSYHLSTCNIDLVVQKEIGKPDAGQDEPKLVLKKSKLPVNWRDAQRGRPAHFYEPHDFSCGKVIDVYGRYFLLVNCDKFTRHVYEEMGNPQRDVRLINEPKAKIVQPIPQLGDGFLAIGSNEDTLATVYGMPKAGRDIEKIQRNQNRLLRCKAVLLSQNPIDSSREFMITFFLEDDTIAVYEEVKRNSGIWGGNFLKRGKYMNDLPNESQQPRIFRPNDIYLGNVISFNGNDFQIIEMDNMSLDFCEHFPDEFPMMDTFKIIGDMMHQIVDRRLDIRPHFRRADTKRRRWLDQAVFVSTLDGLALTADLNDQEVLTLMRRFKDADSYYYEEMCDLVSHVYAKNSSMGTPSTKSRKFTIIDSSLEAFKQNARVRTIQWRRTFRKDPQTHDGFVTLAILEKLFKKHGLQLADAVVDEIRRTYEVDPDQSAIALAELQNLGTEHLYEGLDQKVRPKKRHASNAANTATAALNRLATNAQATNRLKNNLVGSVLRKGNSFDGSALSNDNSSLDVGASVVINFNTLCDDIYICDWI